MVEPGYLLGPQGDEILIDTCTDVDLSRRGSTVTPPASASIRSIHGARPCGSIDGSAKHLLIAAAYAECPTRPVRVQPAGCTPDEAEYSRLRDGFILRVLTSLPDSYADMAPSVDPRLCPVGGHPPPLPRLRE